MPQKFNKKYRKTKGEYRDPVKVSAGPGMEEESQPAAGSWSELVSHLSRPGSQPLRDFTSYYRSSPRAAQPTYSITSHTALPRPHRPKQTICTLPLTQSLRWHPLLVETSTTASRHRPDRLRVCHCAKCMMKTCPIKGDRFQFKDNIMRFNDQSTNTWEVSEAGVGSCPVSRTYLADMMVGPSLVHYTDRSVQFEKVQNAHVKLSTGRRRRRHTQASACFKQNRFNFGYDAEERVSGTSETERSSHTSFSDGGQRERGTRGVMRNVTCKPSVNDTRKVLYNEGIGNDVIEKLPVIVAARKCSMNSVDVRRARLGAGAGAQVARSQLPYGHRNDSRYHRRCKSPPNRLAVVDSRELRLSADCPALKKTCTSRPVTFLRIPNAKYPKPVLESEKICNKK